jgi:hypothetical protein
LSEPSAAGRTFAAATRLAPPASVSTGICASAASNARW